MNFIIIIARNFLQKSNCKVSILSMIDELNWKWGIIVCQI